MAKSTQSKQRELDFLQATQVKLDRGMARAEKFGCWLKRQYYRMDTEKRWAIPFVLITMALFSVVMIPPVLFISVYGWYLWLRIKFPAAMQGLCKAATVIWHLAYCMGLCVVTHLLFIYFGWEQLFQQLLG